MTADEPVDAGPSSGGTQRADIGSPEQSLLEQVYAQLRAIAQQRISEEAPGYTLQATALVHEAWLKLCNSSSVMALGRAQFVFTAAEAMRRVLIDHARSRRRLKRGAGFARQTLTDVAQLAESQDGAEILDLDKAVRRFEEQHPDEAQVVKLRFFAGLSIPETARTLGRSESTVKRDWNFARAWLFRALS